MSENTGQDKATVTEQATAGGEVSGENASLWGDAWRQLIRNPMFIIASIVLVVFIAMAIAPQWFTSLDPNPRECFILDARESPNAAAWFGKDLLGCDYYTRVVYGARNSLLIGVTATLGAVIIALVLGLSAGYYGGIIDTIVSRAVDIIFALPFILGALVFLNVLESRSVWTVAGVLIIFSWPTMTRLMRSSVIAVRQNEYVMAARALGAGGFTIMVRHILPNSLAPLVVLATVMVGGIIGAEATLTFLGVGLQLPAISWGLQLADASQPGYVEQSPHLLLFPAVFVGLAVFCFMVMGDALRDALDPKRK